MAHIGVFKNFMKTYNKSYKGQAEFKKRFSIFRQNMKKVYILQHNEKGSAKYGPTKFADLTGNLVCILLVHVQKFNFIDCMNNMVKNMKDVLLNMIHIKVILQLGKCTDFFGI